LGSSASDEEVETEITPDKATQDQEASSTEQSSNISKKYIKDLPHILPTSPIRNKQKAIAHSSATHVMAHVPTPPSLSVKDIKVLYESK
jgi:hypothetical protein